MGEGGRGRVRRSEGSQLGLVANVDAAVLIRVCSATGGCDEMHAWRGSHADRGAGGVETPPSERLFKQR